MANTRNNSLEDLAVHLPMICDRYELRDDVMPGGRFRGGIGVVKKQRILTDGFITHECDRHTDVPWGIFGGGEGQCGAVEIYNAARPDDISDMPAKQAPRTARPRRVRESAGQPRRLAPSRGGRHRLRPHPTPMRPQSRIWWRGSTSGSAATGASTSSVATATAAVSRFWPS